MVCLNSSANLMCSWSCHVSPSAAKRACSDTILSLRSVLNRLSSSAKRRTCSGSMIAWAIVSLSVCVCGSPGRRVFAPGAPDLLKPALFPPARQILTATPACPRRSHRTPCLLHSAFFILHSFVGGFGVALGWLWGGFGVAFGWLWGGFRVALGWPWGGFRVPIPWLSIGFGVALGGLGRSDNKRS